MGISETQGHIAILDNMRGIFLRDSRLAGSPVLQVAEVSGLVKVDSHPVIATVRELYHITGWGLLLRSCVAEDGRSALHGFYRWVPWIILQIPM